ncbi:hypothetical protein [Micromonospora rubida]|uniref:hypothetical protein n=1 Tax=Micromonospora rubida TaxID=2697657 RepID=UPI0013790716|nr:hypothetical protein [Micromonospora rubida]NBE81540.1 hypothetical protein [Micromonospora rubida]
MKITSSSVGTFTTASPPQQVSMARGTDGRILIAARANGLIYTGWITSDSVKTANSYAGTGAKAASAPVAVAAADGRMAVFYRDPGNQLMCLREKADHTGWENPAWVAGALMLGDPAVGRIADGRIEIYLTGTDGALYHTWANSYGAESWQPSVKFGGGNIRELATTSTADGWQAFFHLNGAGQVWMVQQTPPSGAWSAFCNPVNGVGGQLAVARARNFPLIGMFPTPDGLLASFQQNTAGVWSGPAQLSFGQATAPGAYASVRPVLLPGPTQGQLIVVHYGAGQQWIVEEPANGSGPWTVLQHTPKEAAGKVASQAATFDGTTLTVATCYASGLQYDTYTCTA